MITITDKTKTAIRIVGDYCFQDSEVAEFADDPEVWAETVIDADRMTMHGFPDADEEIGRLIDQFGYDAVAAEVQKLAPGWRS